MSNKINIIDVKIRYHTQYGLTNLFILFTIGYSHVHTELATVAICSPSDKFSERTGRKIAMKRACDILGVTMREIGEVM